MTTAPSNNETALLYSKPNMASIGVVAALAIFYILIAVCAITSNITVLIAIARQLVPRNTVNVFFSSLAVSDLLMVALSLMDCSAYLNGGWVFGEVACKIQSLLLEVSFSASTLTLVAVSCERYLLICQPHMKQRSIQNIYHLLASVWLLSIAIASPLLHGYIVVEDIDELAKTRQLLCSNEGWSTKYRLIYYSTYSIVVYVTPLIVMAFTHMKISRAVREHNRRQEFSLFEPKKQHNRNSAAILTIKDADDASTDTTPTDEPKVGFHHLIIGSIMQLRQKSTDKSSVESVYKRNDRRIKAVRMLFVVTVTFFLLWTPFIIMRVVSLTGGAIDSYLYKFSELLVFSSTAVNGFIYAYMSTPFRKAFKAILCCQDKNHILAKTTGTTNSVSEEQRPRTTRSGTTAPNNASSPNKDYCSYNTCVSSQAKAKSKWRKRNNSSNV